MSYDDIRIDHRIILRLIEPRAAVLDLGCGSGDLLYVLTKEKNARGQGIEINEQSIYKCVAKGLNVFHGDIDSGLAEYHDKTFDYVILNQSLQQVRQVKTVLDDSLRVGKRVIIGLPNFAYYKARLQMFFLGRAPVTGALPFQWYETQNLRFLSSYDFIHFCLSQSIRIESKFFIGAKSEIILFPNLFAQGGVYLISR